MTINEDIFMFKRFLILLLFLIIGFCIVSSASAIDNNDTDIQISDCDSVNGISGDTNSDIISINTTQGKIEADDFDAEYNSGKPYTIRVTENGSGNVISGVNLKIIFSNAKNSQTEYYTTNSEGIVTFNPSLNAGTYSIRISCDDSNISANPIEKTATVKKSSVSIKTSKTTSYKGKKSEFTIHGIITPKDIADLNNKGFKVTLKAIVESQGKRVGEGTVVFKINGKTYSVAVKDGVATKTVKFKKVKNYKYSATFISDNFETKKVKENQTAKKRYATKITGVKSLKGPSLANFKKVTFKITTKGGKKVKNGYLHIYDKTNGYHYYSTVKNGNVKFSLIFINNYYSIEDDGLYYHNKVVSKYEVSYIPISSKYKASSMSFKKTVYYKCPFCGKTGTHNHFPYTKHIVTYD